MTFSKIQLVSVVRTILLGGGCCLFLTACDGGGSIDCANAQNCLTSDNTADEAGSGGSGSTDEDSGSTGGESTTDESPQDQPDDQTPENSTDNEGNNPDSTPPDENPDEDNDSEDPNNGNNETDNTNENGNPDDNGTVVSGLSLRHRSGQTFITWDEPAASAGYHVYRSDQPITTDNIDSAVLLTSRWGPLDNNTSLHRYAVTDVPAYFVIEDLGAPLADNSGLFVHTVDNSGTGYYAVTTVLDGFENRAVIAGQNSASVQEFTGTPQPVLTLSVNGGKGRLYTQYMDYQQWNPTLNGYAFNYFVALPFNYNPSRSYPLQVELHAYGYFPTLLEEVRYQWQVIQLMPIDPGDQENTFHTWWYGHARDHDYRRNGDTPFQGVIENFTEQRVMKAINETINNPEFNIDSNLTHVYGNSMGASGSVSLGLRYPSVFAGVYASQPMMNYQTSTRFRTNFRRLFGPVDQNLPIVNRGLYSDAIQRYGEGGSQPTGVWNWMNHHEQVRRRRADDFSYLMIDFGKADDVIDWQTQGNPTFSAFTDARVAYSATAREGIGHEWRAFDAVNQNLYQFEVGSWRYPNDLSYPGLHNASGSGRLYPPSSGDDLYQTNLEWSTPQYGFGSGIVDQTSRYEITLRSTASEQRADITPRNTRQFNPAVNAQCNWTARRVSDGQTTDSGVATVDSSRLVTASQVAITTGSGTRVSFNCP